MTLDDYIRQLPPYIGKEIFKFIIPDSLLIKYDDNRVQTALINDKPIKNTNGEYLTRYKKNSHHRYYLKTKTIRCFCDGCGREDCHSRGCRGGHSYEIYYTSRFVGKHVDKALLELALANRPVPILPIQDLENLENLNGW